jgi:L-fuconolactonase
MAPLRRDLLPNDLKAELERGGFQGCVAVQARQSLEESSWLWAMTKQEPFILGVVGWIELRSPQVRVELNALACDPKFVGIRHLVPSELR